MNEQLKSDLLKFLQDAKLVLASPWAYECDRLRSELEKTPTVETQD